MDQMSSEKFVISCIDYRYPDYLTQFLNSYCGLNQQYYLGTVAGASLPISYSAYCRNYGGGCTCKSWCTNNLLKTGVLTNVDISMQLSTTIDEIFIINHQDCGAFKTFLPASGYPKELGKDNTLEIKIQQQSMFLTQTMLQKRYYPYWNRYYDPQISLFLMDINGSVARYENEEWKVIFYGPGNDARGWWVIPSPPLPTWKNFFVSYLFSLLAYIGRPIFFVSDV